MPYSSFSLLQVQRQFDLKVVKGIFFNDLPTLAAGKWLTDLLSKSAPFAAAQGSEKVRSELIVAPLLFELRELLDRQIGLFSGTDFTIDVESGLNGVCDFLLTRSTPLVLLPIHVAFLHLIIDPACSIVLEAEPAEANVMKRPPRNPKEPLFGKKTLGLALLQGGGILVIILTVFAIATYRKQGELDIRALTFTTLIIANLGLILSESSTSRLSLKILKSPNPALWWVIGGGVFFMAIVLYVPFLRELFSFSFLHSIDLAICLGGGLISLLWFELLKQTTKRDLK